MSLSYQPVAQRMTVVVLKARHLPKMDITGLSGSSYLLRPISNRPAKPPNPHPPPARGPASQASFLLSLRPLSPTSLPGGYLGMDFAGWGGAWGEQLGSLPSARGKVIGPVADPLPQVTLLKRTAGTLSLCHPESACWCHEVSADLTRGSCYARFPLGLLSPCPVQTGGLSQCAPPTTTWGWPPREGQTTDPLLLVGEDRVIGLSPFLLSLWGPRPLCQGERLLRQKAHRQEENPREEVHFGPRLQ